MTIELGIPGCGSVFEAYGRKIKPLECAGRAKVVGAFDPEPRRRAVAYGFCRSALTDTGSPETVVGLTIRALGASKDVLVEKPMHVGSRRATDRVPQLVNCGEAA